MKTKFSDIQLSDSDIDEYASQVVEGWDMDSLVSFAVDTIYSECQKMYQSNKDSLIQEMADHFGESWLREKRLQSFK